MDRDILVKVDGERAHFKLKDQIYDALAKAREAGELILPIGVDIHIKVLNRSEAMKFKAKELSSREERDDEDWYRLIEDMLDNPKYEYAGDFLFSLGEQLEGGKSLTDKQKQGVQNILNKTR